MVKKKKWGREVHGEEKCMCVEKGCACGKSACKEDGAGMRKKTAQVKLACRPTSTRLNTVRWGGGMTPFSHRTGYGVDVSGLTIEKVPSAMLCSCWFVWLC